jgi:hypothetical protein
MTTFTIQPSSIDSCIKGGAATTNYGTDTTIDTYAGTRFGLFKFDLSLAPAAGDIISVAFHAYMSSATGTSPMTTNLYRIYRAWVETQVTWNIWKTSNNWSTAGCGNTTSDRTATVMGTLDVTNTVEWKIFNLDLTEFESMRASNNGFLMWTTGASIQRIYYSREYAVDTTLCPKLVFTVRAGYPKVVVI